MKIFANLSTTTNGTQPPNCSNPAAMRIGQTFAYCLLFVVSLLGYIFIGLIVYKTKTMRKTINYLILNMAMSDLLFAIFMPSSFLRKLYVDSWLISGPLGQALCKLTPFFQYLSAAVSTQSLVLIAVDRFGAVVFPLRSPLISSKLRPFFILGTWIIAVAMQCPLLFSWKLVEHPVGGIACVGQWDEIFGQSFSFRNYALANFIIFLFVPWVLITILYLAIILKLKSQKIPGEQSVNAREQRVKTERNVLKMCIAIVLAFAVCWVPLSTVWFIFLFSLDNTMISSCSFRYFHSFFIVLAYANCAINPCICFIFSGNYREGLKNLLSCRSADLSANEVTS